MNVYLPNLRLPSAYQEVEYIASSGTQYFIVGSTFKTSYKTVLDFQMTQIGGDYIPLGLNNQVSSSNIYRYGVDVYGGYFKVITGSSSDWSNTKAEDTNRHTLTIDNSTATMDSSSYTISGYRDYTYSKGIGVFAYNDDSTMQFHSSVKIYKLDIYDENGTHINELIPCYRKSDSVIGLYDLVNNQFYTNSGTGTFSKGNDVTMAELKNAYIGGVWTPGSNTIAYYKFDGNLNDSSGNSRNMAMEQGSFTYSTLASGAKYVQTAFNTYTTGITIPFSTVNGTISFWMSFINNTIGNGNTSKTSGATVFELTSYMRLVLSWYMPGWVYGVFDLGNDDNNRYTPAVSESWHHYTFTFNNGSMIMYVDGTQRTTGSVSTNSSSNFRLNSIDGSSTQKTDYSSRDKLSEMIFENTIRTSDQVLSYYNQTKSNYS